MSGSPCAQGSPRPRPESRLLMSQRQDNEVQLRLKHLETVTFSKKKSFAGTLLTTEPLLIKKSTFYPFKLCPSQRGTETRTGKKKKKIFRNKDNDTEAHIKSNKYFILKVSVVVTFLSLSLPQGKQF